MAIAQAKTFSIESPPGYVAITIQDTVLRPDLDARLVAAVLANGRTAADDVVFPRRPYPDREVALGVSPLLSRGNTEAEHRPNAFAD